jgi:hypothetical protein
MVLQSLAGLLPALLVYLCTAIIAVVASPRLHPHHVAQRVPTHPRQRSGGRDCAGLSLLGLWIRQQLVYSDRGH